MKKIVCCAVFALVLGGTLFSQTWITRDENGVEIEATIITREEYNRLKRQFEASRSVAMVVYVDKLEGMITGGRGEVISGRQPRPRGYYYIILKQKLDEAGKLLGTTPCIIYGHAERGVILLMFNNGWGGMLEMLKTAQPGTWFDVNSAEYQRKVRQYTGFVEGR
jgi:hypothetical protein